MSNLGGAQNANGRVARTISRSWYSARIEDFLTESG